MLNQIGPGAATLLIAMVIASLVGLFVAPRWLERCLFRPYWFLRNREYSTIVTSGFVHADVPHLLFNGITFWFFGIPLERILGTGLFLTLFAAGLLLSNVGTYVRHRNNANYATLGASGAIAAVLFASIVYMPTQSLFILPIPFPIPAPLFGVGYLAYSWWSSRQNRGRINHDAHFSGAITGLMFVALVHPGAYPRAIELLTR